MAYDITGKVKLIQDAQTFGSGFTKRELVVIVEDGKYPQEINIEFVQDKIDLLENLNIGDMVMITFDIRGREYNGRYFNNLQGWKLNVDTAYVEPAAGSPAEESERPDYTEEEQDIPF